MLNIKIKPKAGFDVRALYSDLALITRVTITPASEGAYMVTLNNTDHLGRVITHERASMMLGDLSC